MATDEPRGEWVPAITLEATATVEQRQRNAAFYQRIRDGVPGDDREGGLKQFVFEVPVADCTVGGRPPMFTFRLDPASECYARLCRYIVGHTDSKCDADDEVKRLRAEVERLRSDTEFRAVREERNEMSKAVFALTRERDTLRAELERLDRGGGLGLDVHKRIRAVLDGGQP